MKSINKDSRHTNINLLQEKKIQEKLYPNDNVKIIRILDSDSEMVSHILDIKERYI